jgi:hypothetical protein
VGQIDTLRDCFRLVEDFEEPIQMKFNWVTRIRPGSMVLRPVAPVCTLDPRFFYLPATSLIDWAGIFGREASGPFLRYVDGFFGCKSGVLDWRKKSGILNIKERMFEQPFLASKRKRTDI